MSRWVDALAALALAASFGGAMAQDKYPGVGRDATPKEVAAWDIDVRPDFKGLPRGSGSVAQGQDVWEAKCASCHGVFGESNSVFNPLVGGTTKEDVASGRVASLKRTDYPARTTLMKVSTVSTLWDYINRAMPWNQPKSLKPDEVFAVTAYLLSLADIVPGDFTLSDRNIADVQKRMPNRDGMTTDHALWPGPGITSGKRADVAASACMKDCPTGEKVTSQLPVFARNAHGNLAEQNRAVGAQHGVNTSSAAPAPAAAKVAVADPNAGAAQALMKQNNCIACHSADSRIVGPSWREVAAKHTGKADYLAAKIKSGGSGTWGATPMPPQTLSDADARRIAEWLAAGARN